MTMTGLKGMRHRLIQHLSKGYRQRVGIAQALVGSPEVIILDEPTVGLDPRQIIEIRDLMKSLAKNHTVILSSHIMQEISAVCDYIMIINHGKLVLSGTPEQLQKDANKEDNLELEAETTKEQMLQVLSGVSGITEILDRTAENEQTCALYVKCEKDIRKEIFAAFAKAGIPVLKLMKDVKTMEDIFLEATRERWEEETETSGETTEEKEEA